MSSNKNKYIQSSAPYMQEEASSSSSATPQRRQGDIPLQQQASPYYYDSSPAPNSANDSGTDPQWTKWTSSLWKRAGQAQALLGQWSSIGEWETSGRSTESWADEEYRKAEEQMQSGTPSRTHGEYERIMGVLGTVVGHVAGDPEMEAQFRLRSRQGQEEIDRSKH